MELGSGACRRGGHLEDSSRGVSPSWDVHSQSWHLGGFPFPRLWLARPPLPPDGVRTPFSAGPTLQQGRLGAGGRGHTGLRCALSLVDLSPQADLPGTP